MIALRYTRSARATGCRTSRGAIPTPRKIALVDLLTSCGLTHIEAASFVSPKWVPQMADGAAVLAGIARRPGVTYAALTPNLKGYEAARAARAGEVAIFASASESFSRRNINCSIAESLARFAPVAEAAGAGRDAAARICLLRDGLPVRGRNRATDGRSTWQNACSALGCREVSLGDTIGHGTPDSVARMLQAVLECRGPERLAGHFHDTARAGARQYRGGARLRPPGVRCGLRRARRLPFAPGSAGNVATERVVARLAELGFETGIDLAGWRPRPASRGVSARAR